MKYKVMVDMGVVEGDTLEEARQKAYNRLQYYAESNDGSEVLANAEPTLEPILLAKKSSCR